MSSILVQTQPARGRNRRRGVPAYLLPTRTPVPSYGGSYGYPAARQNPPGQGSSRSARRRRNRRQRAVARLPAPVVPRARRRARNQVAAGGVGMLRNAYMMCRLRPFETHGNNTGVPDGTTTRRILVDHRYTATITFGSVGAVGILITPAVPSPVWLYITDVTTKVNGTIILDNVASNLYVPLCLTEWSSSNLVYYNTAGTYDYVSPLYGATKFRVVTCGWSIAYTGTTMTDSGIMVVNQADVTLEPPVPNSASYVVASSTSATNTTFSVDQVYTRSYNGMSASQTMSGYGNTDQTRVMALKASANGVLRHAGNSYNYQPLSQFMTFASAPDTQGQSILMNTIPTPSIAAQSGLIQGFDNNWSSTSINIAGGTTGQSFVLDVVFCVEYVPVGSSTIVTLARQGPSDQPELIRATENALKRMPIAEPGTAVKAALDVARVAASVAQIML